MSSWRKEAESLNRELNRVVEDNKLESHLPSECHCVKTREVAENSARTNDSPSKGHRKFLELQRCPVSKDGTARVTVSEIPLEERRHRKLHLSNKNKETATLEKNKAEQEQSMRKKKTRWSQLLLEDTNKPIDPKIPCDRGPSNDQSTHQNSKRNLKERTQLDQCDMPKTDSKEKVVIDYVESNLVQVLREKLAQCEKHYKNVKISRDEDVRRLEARIQSLESAVHLKTNLLEASKHTVVDLVKRLDQALIDKDRMIDEINRIKEKRHVKNEISDNCDSQLAQAKHELERLSLESSQTQIAMLRLEAERDQAVALASLYHDELDFLKSQLKKEATAIRRYGDTFDSSIDTTFRSGPPITSSPVHSFVKTFDIDERQSAILNSPEEAVQNPIPGPSGIQFVRQENSHLLNKLRKDCDDFFSKAKKEANNLISLAAPHLLDDDTETSLGCDEMKIKNWGDADETD